MIPGTIEQQKEVERICNRIVARRIARIGMWDRLSIYAHRHMKDYQYRLTSGTVICSWCNPSLMVGELPTGATIATILYRIRIPDPFTGRIRLRVCWHGPIYRPRVYGG